MGHCSSPMPFFHPRVRVRKHAEYLHGMRTHLHGVRTFVACARTCPQKRIGAKPLRLGRARRRADASESLRPAGAAAPAPAARTALKPADRSQPRRRRRRAIAEPARRWRRAIAARWPTGRAPCTPEHTGRPEPDPSRSLTRTGSARACWGPESCTMIRTSRR